MNFKYRTLGILLAALPFTACATHDHQDTYLLGQATADNIARQSVRDVNLSNSKAVESTSGLRAANAVKALNEGRTKELRDSSVSESGGS